jgi:hypothetical protein
MAHQASLTQTFTQLRAHPALRRLGVLLPLGLLKAVEGFLSGHPSSAMASPGRRRRIPLIRKLILTNLIFMLAAGASPQSEPTLAQLVAQAVAASPKVAARQLQVNEAEAMAKAMGLQTQTLCWGNRSISPELAQRERKRHALKLTLPAQTFAAHNFPSPRSSSSLSPPNWPPGATPTTPRPA